MWGTFGSTNQDLIQLVLLVLGVICIPLMLLPKPIIQIREHNKHKKESAAYDEHERQSLIAGEELGHEAASHKEIKSVKKI